MEKGLDIKEQVQNQLSKYLLQDKLRVEQVKKMLESKGNNWDKDIKNKKGQNIENLTLLLAYEYCLATEKITDGRISFEEALDKLSNIDKFRLGEPKAGDAIIIYGKSVDDPNAVSIESEEYDNVRRTTGAQYTDYVDEDGKLRSAVFIFGKKLLKDGHYTAGMDFDDLSDIRQTVFHEWNHNAEQEKIEIDSLGNSNKIQRKYKSLDGKIYTNYKAVTQYRLPIFKRGVFARMSEPVEIETDEKMGISQGFSTSEELPRTIKMHNQITEGFVEMYARKMVLAIDPDAKIDENKYYEHTEIAKRIDSSRDGKNNIGKTAADFLSHSIILKKELEEKNIDDKKDGLHYISDYVDDVRKGATEKKKIMAAFNEIAKISKLRKNQIMDIQKNPFWSKGELKKEDGDEIINVFENYIKEFEKGSPIYDKLVKAVNRYVLAVNKEKQFFDNIPNKLGYAKFEKNGQNLDDSNDSFEY